MGNLSQVSCKHVRLAWKRWEIHTTHCIQFHKGDLEQSLMDPTVSQLAHYLGERSTAGETAASGASAGLWRMVKALQLDFPLEEPILRGWSARLITRQPTQQIPIEVAEAAHFQYWLEHSNNPYAILTCTTQWITMVGVIRDAHIQRSRLIRETEHAYFFHRTVPRPALR